MTADKFIASLGVLDVELSPEIEKLIIARVTDFFQCGGTLAWEDYLQMDDKTRDLFRGGQRLLRALQAQEELAQVGKMLEEVK